MVLFNGRKELKKEFRERLECQNIPYIITDLSDELAALELSVEEKKELDLEKSQIDDLITAGYKLLNLITFLQRGKMRRGPGQLRWAIPLHKPEELSIPTLNIALSQPM